MEWARIVTTFPIAASLKTQGVESTLWTYGIVFAVVGFLAAQAYGCRRHGVAAAMQRCRVATGALQICETVFWLMFVMMT